jgi:PST family polysaccharide transporter
VLAGGAYLVARQVAVLVLGVAGAVALTRLIGPASYGLYAGSLAVVVSTATLARFGSDVFLARRLEPPAKELYDEVFTMLLVLGVVLGAGGAGLASVVLPHVTNPDFVGPTQVLLLMLPLTILSVPAIAALERELDYRAVALIEVGGYGVFNTVAVALAVADFGVEAPIAGYACWQFVVLVSSYLMASYRPRLRLSRAGIRELGGYGAGYTVAEWTWVIRDLVNPFVVGRFLGPRAVGYVSVALLIARSLEFAKSVMYRVSLVALGRIQRERARLGRAVDEAAILQIVATGPFLVGFAVSAPWIVPWVFGEQWSSVLKVFSFVALASIVNSVFNIQSSLLHVVARNRFVTYFHLVMIVVFFGSASLLVPRYGLVGYGLSEVAAFSSYWVVHRAARRVTRVSYRSVVPWLAAFGPPLFAPLVPGLWRAVLCLSLLLIVLSPARRRELLGYVRYIRRLRSTGPVAPATGGT